MRIIDHATGRVLERTATRVKPVSAYRPVRIPMITADLIGAIVCTLIAGIAWGMLP